MFTRQGHSPNVLFPRILGIECVGLIAASPGDHFPLDTPVATAMGGLGRDIDGGYAEYTVVPAKHVVALGRADEKLKLGWETLGALPEMLQTAWGSLVGGLQVKGKTAAGETERVLVRGGTTSVGLAAASIAKGMGCSVGATTRRKDEGTERLLRSSGVDEVFVDGECLIPASPSQFPPKRRCLLTLCCSQTAISLLKSLARNTTKFLN